MMIKKTAIIAALEEELNNRLEMIVAAYNDARDSRNNDDKSSAGDKYETGREMAQQEMNNLELRIQEIKMMQGELKRLPVEQKNISVATGSLVITNLGTYFIGVALGKIIHEKRVVYAISSLSPLGRLLIGKKVGDEISLNNRVQKILGIQ